MKRYPRRSAAIEFERQLVGWSKNYEDSTAEQYRCCVRSFVQFISPFSLSNAEVRHARRFLEHLPLPHRRRARSALFGFYEYLRTNRRKYCKNNPFENLIPGALETELTKEAIQALTEGGFDAAVITWHDMMIIALDEGPETPFGALLASFIGNSFSAPGAFRLILQSSAEAAFRGTER